MAEKRTDRKQAEGGSESAPSTSGSSGRGLKGSLTAMGTIAVLGVYAAGYIRTEAAALQMEHDLAARRLATALPIEPRLDPASLQEATRAAAGAAQGDPGGAGQRATPLSEPESLPTAPASSATPNAAPRSAEIPTAESSPAIAAAQAAAAAPVEPVVPRSPYADGSFKAVGWETRHGQVEAAVEIVDGHITSAYVTYCGMRWSCSDVNELMARVPQMQTPRVGIVSGASQTSEAFTSAVATALSYSMAAKLGVYRPDPAAK